MSRTSVPSPIAGSFRDPHARVLDLDGRVLRALDDVGARDFAALEATELFRSAQREGALIATRRVPADERAALVGSPWVELLEHDRVPVISYPYEWTFSMLRDGALLHLDLVARALADGLTCKDGTAFNIQFVDGRPVFIDVGSFTSLGADVWPGYRQFCSQLLYPLLIEAHLGVSPAPLLRGSLEGITPLVASRLLRGTAALRPGVLTHVKAQALVARRYAERTDPAASVVREGGVAPELTAALVAKLTKVISALRAPSGPSEWSEYGGRGHYDGAALEAKDRFLAAVLDQVRPETVVDLGCNDGRYSEVALDHGATVVALDADRRVVDQLYRRTAGSGRPLLPLVTDLADPSPGLGWALRERAPLADRVRPDLVLALALIHHLVIGRAIPVPAVVDHLAALAPEVVLEVPHRRDPMVQRLLAPKPPGTHDDYHEDRIARAVGARFVVLAEEVLPGAERTLLHLRRR